MATPRLTDDQLKESVALYNAHDRNMTTAATAAGLPRSTFQSRIRDAATRGLLLDHPAAMPGFVVKATSEQQDAQGNVTARSIKQVREPGEEFTVPAGHVIKGVSALLDPDGRELAKWVKTKEGLLDPLQVAEWIKDAFKDMKPAARKTATPSARDDLLTLLPCNDWHVGMFAWGKEVGENWDLKIAEETIGSAAEETLDRSPASGTCVVLGGGDLLHADNSENKTARSGNVLQVDGRYQKVVHVAIRLMARTIDAAVRRHKHVIVRILPGNHDEHTAVAVTYGLHAWYRNEPRVTVDCDPSLFWWHRFGAVMLGATHGHTVKLAQMPSIMAHRRAEDWGATKFRYVHGFHLHHKAKVATEGDGCVCETHQAPIPQDAWHYGAGFLSGRSLQSITYHRDYGEISRIRTAILDAAPEQEPPQCSATSIAKT